MSTKIGVIGLGNMGGAVAARLIHRGQSLVVYDINQDAIKRIVDLGATAATSSKQVASQVGILITNLPNGPNVEAAARGSDGVLAGAQPDLIWLEMSTIDPEVSIRLAEQAAQQQVSLLDVAIGKLPNHALAGELLLMAGGDESQLEKVKPILTHLGQLIYCGPTGSGAAMKLVNNQLAGITFAATCEALLLGHKAGLSFETMQQVLSQTAANTAHLQGSVSQKIIPRQFEPGFRFDLMVKDAGLALGMAHRLEAPQMLGSLVQQLRTMGLNQDLQAQDTSAFIKVFEQLAGATLEER
ncbi:MAG: NAD(P)-dependent oxidoreductase [Chloroflexota bacterium]